MEGPMEQRLSEREDRVKLLDFLLTELQAARITAVNTPEIGDSLFNLQIVPTTSVCRSI